MEIFCQEINKGPMNFEVSVHDSSERANPGTEPNENAPPYFVVLTARDESSRKIWTTPVMAEDGAIKSYNSVDEAVEDARKKIR
jgi:hypothetical protein